MKIAVVIPARLASSRLPEKPLIEIVGKSMIQRTYEQCIEAIDESKVYVATDSERIYNHCNNLGIQVVLTSENCLTGTDRIAEFSRKVKADYYINVQGDEPLINPNDIIEVKNSIEKFPDKIINGYAKIHDSEMYFSKSIPKVIFRPDGRLLYMSRSPIPGNKSGDFQNAWRQICIYSFPASFLELIYNTNKKTELESIEDIEILRFLELGFEVQMVELSGNSVAVDTKGDLNKVVEIIKNNND